MDWNKRHHFLLFNMVVLERTFAFVNLFIIILHQKWKVYFSKFCLKWLHQGLLSRWDNIAIFDFLLNFLNICNYSHLRFMDYTNWANSIKETTCLLEFSFIYWMVSSICLASYAPVSSVITLAYKVRSMLWYQIIVRIEPLKTWYDVINF